MSETKAARERGTPGRFVRFAENCLDVSALAEAGVNGRPDEALGNFGAEMDAANDLPTGSRRYGRLETCATKWRREVRGELLLVLLGKRFS